MLNQLVAGCLIQLEVPSGFQASLDACGCLSQQLASQATCDHANSKQTGRSLFTDRGQQPMRPSISDRRPPPSPFGLNDICRYLERV